LGAIQRDHSQWFTGIRQSGVIFGLEFSHPEGAKYVMRRLYERGVWAIFSTLDPSVLQYKPGILMDDDLADELLWLTGEAIAAAAYDAAPA
jgi:acetylornithine/succinyldiaminopimelate/putrescine aminotransferase